MTAIRLFLRRFYWLLSAQFGVDPRIMLRSVRGLPSYVHEYIRFRAAYDGRLEWLPCLHDRYDEGGQTRSEYFWQDLLVARRIYEAKPEKHVDVGSRVDGFVAHVASFRDLEVFDVRPVTARIPGVTFKQADLMRPLAGMARYCDSLSCLHALEHFGLGRYGDPVNPRGFELGLANMAALLKDGGVLYLSVPVGMARVEFNAQRIFDPGDLLALAAANTLQLSDLTVIGPEGAVAVTPVASQLADLAGGRYALGLFTFLKKGADR